MSVLSAEAREDFVISGVNLRELAAATWGDGKWHGDECGCTDDRCIGHHHDETEECQCRPAVIRRYLTDKAAAAEASDLWAAHQAALEAGDEFGAQRARDGVAAWVHKYYPHAPSWSLDEVVDGERGISVTSSYNDRHWVMWVAPA